MSKRHGHRESCSLLFVVLNPYPYLTIVDDLPFSPSCMYRYLLPENPVTAIEYTVVFVFFFQKICQFQSEGRVIRIQHTRSKTHQIRRQISKGCWVSLKFFGYRTVV